MNWSSLIKCLIAAGWLGCLAMPASADISEYEFCLGEQISRAADDQSIGELKQTCKNKVEDKQRLEQQEILSKNTKQHESQTLDPTKSDNEVNAMTPLEKRLLREKLNKDNPNVITSHKPNYLLPFTWVDRPNNTPYQNAGQTIQLDNFEAKFQLSFKAPLAEDLWKKQDSLFFGFTMQSFWQVYNQEVSSPFRETNYQPEIFYGIFNDFRVGQWTNRVNVIGIEHQSNGRSQPLSRSWNRVYAELVWENDNWLVMFKPWYRLPETEKTDPMQPDGDDNPDIDTYLGFFELSSVYKWDRQNFGITLRNNLRGHNKGALQLDWTFPMGRRFKGYAQFFSGHGESLIDYNHKVQRLGIGVLLTDVF